MSIVTIHYRLSPPNHLFPLPIHDTFTAFNHIRNHILPNINSPTPSPGPPPINVYGSHIGGSLALSLALTEPTNLQSLAVSSPLTTWVELEDSDITNISTSTSTNPYSKSSTKEATLTALNQATLTLRTLRNSLFPKPETYFDPFASPAHFLRSPPRDCPPETGSLDHQYQNFDNDDDNPTILLPKKRRRVLKRWNPLSSSTPTFPPPTRILIPRIPSVPITSTTTNNNIPLILRHQSKELLDLMRRACFWGRGDAAFAEKMVSLEEVDLATSTSIDERGKEEEEEEEEVEMAKRAATWIRDRISDDIKQKEDD